MVGAVGGIFKFRCPLNAHGSTHCGYNVIQNLFALLFWRGEKGFHECLLCPTWLFYREVSLIFQIGLGTEKYKWTIAQMCACVCSLSVKPLRPKVHQTHNTTHWGWPQFSFPKQGKSEITAELLCFLLLPCKCRLISEYFIPFLGNIIPVMLVSHY